MKEEKIRALEPKYMGNTRPLTEGEASEIVHDPANGERDLDEVDGLVGMATAIAFADRGNGANGNNNE